MAGLDSAVAASPARTAAAAAGSLAVAVDLLLEAAAAGDHSAGAAEEERRVAEEAAALLARLPRLQGGEDVDEVHRALADCALIAREIAHLAEFLAEAERRPCPLALAAAHLAETSAQMVLECVAAEETRPAVDVLSRRARQLVEIHQIETRLDAAVARLAEKGIHGSAGKRAFRHSKAPRLTDADWDS